MISLSVRFTLARVLLVLGALLGMLLIAGMALHLSVTQLNWLEPARATAPYFACWRALLYTLMFAGWAAALRRRPTPADQQRLKRLGLIGFSSIILVELSRV
ncbi:TPA: hypothetical protein QEM85_000236 [Pseudomonas putida]|uniref:hypothetical protein n=1 Tax=Pseudomonas putida TaxID=303 RepID=UPI00110CEBD2|nr:hypothetical protein [Pseudomonas putida]MDD1992804.1 hypothetical protein [Pseudomonas putida]HDS0918356.1 hypothetical protein [Pseudomonas putida]HDS0931637.1 hypothetical protein [Pseudomonas putida]HDS1782265.1 hypothetical protein [Pseudomonas putida]HDS3796914.1 hypothetical protein [Pseudomonas putida]